MPRKTHGRNFRLFDNYTFYVPGVAELLILVLWLVAGAVAGNLVTFAFSAFLGPEAAVEYSTVVAYPLMFIPAMVWASARSSRGRYVRSGVRLDSSNFGRCGWLGCSLMVMAATLAAAFCMDLFNSMLPPMPKWLEDTLKGMTGGNFWLNFICVSVFAPFFEEWLCRGMVLRGLLSNKVRPFWAIVISGAFFALIHLNLWQALPAFVLGCLFGYVYYRTGSLKLTMLMHFTNNTFALLCGQSESLKDMNYWTEVLPPVQYGVIFAAGILLLALVILELSRIPAKSAEGSLETVPSDFDDRSPLC